MLAAKIVLQMREIKFDPRWPWRLVAASLLNEAIGNQQQLDAIDRAHTCAQTALAFSHVHQLVAAEAALVRAEEHLSAAPEAGASDRVGVATFTLELEQHEL